MSSLLASQVLSKANKKLANGCVLATVTIRLMGPWPALLPRPLVLIIACFMLASVALALLFVEALPSVIEVSAMSLGLLLDDKLMDKFAGLLCMTVFIGEIVSLGQRGRLIPLLGVPKICAVISSCGCVVLLAYILINACHRKAGGISIELLDSSISVYF